MSEKMRIWDQVCTTDPAYTKNVNQRGGFTSIAAQYQIQRATNIFGPCGSGWGYSTEYGYHDAGNAHLLYCDLTLWWVEDGEKRSFGPVRAMNEYINGKGYVDDDAAKKAMTDALTKALSHLGFSADVFLGMYDLDGYKEHAAAETDKTNHPERYTLVDEESLNQLIALAGSIQITPEQLLQRLKTKPQFKALVSLEEMSQEQHAFAMDGLRKLARKHNVEQARSAA